MLCCYLPGSLSRLKTNQLKYNNTQGVYKLKISFMGLSSGIPIQEEEKHYGGKEESNKEKSGEETSS